VTSHVFVAPRYIGAGIRCRRGGRVFGRLEERCPEGRDRKKMGEDLLIEGYIASAQSDKVG